MEVTPAGAVAFEKDERLDEFILTFVRESAEDGTVDEVAGIVVRTDDEIDGGDEDDNACDDVVDGADD